MPQWRNKLQKHAKFVFKLKPGWPKVFGIPQPMLPGYTLIFSVQGEFQHSIYGSGDYTESRIAWIAASDSGNLIYGWGKTAVQLSPSYPPVARSFFCGFPWDSVAIQASKKFNCNIIDLWRKAQQDHFPALQER